MKTEDRLETTKIPLLIARAHLASNVHKTGSWRFARPVQALKTAPCSRTCPAGEDIAGIETMLATGRVREAWEMMMQENPFPAICGHVCFHTCETVCNRAELDDAVAIHYLEQYAGLQAIEEKFPCPDYNGASNSRRVAIIGSGPSGLSAAYFLTRLGYGCDVFEKEADPGGILRWGIPIFRLPEGILTAEISRIRQMGVIIHLNEAVTRSRFEQIQRTFDAVYLGCGTGRPLTMGIVGEELVKDGLHLLHQIRDRQEVAPGGHTAVIGGGNTAIDVARSLIRLGDRVTLVYRRRRQDMPAFSNEIVAALGEGVNLIELASPAGVTETARGLAVALNRMTVRRTDAGGRAVVNDSGEALKTLHVHAVVRAIGAGRETVWHLPSTGDAARVQLSHSVLTGTGTPVVSGGDLTNDTRSVADAIASGKQAAMAIDIYFSHGRDAIVDRLDQCRVGDGTALSMNTYIRGCRPNRSPEAVAYRDINTDYFTPAPRIVATACYDAETTSRFAMAKPVFSGSQAVSEAGRCFNCGSCNDCDNCRVFCPEMAVSEQGERAIDLNYCKGCGICVEECPRYALSLVEEKT